jgi:hypothetical protein
MKAIVACEYSGRVRDALTKKGIDAISCDLLPSRTEGKHYQGDVRDINGGSNQTYLFGKSGWHDKHLLPAARPNNTPILFQGE